MLYYAKTYKYKHRYKMHKRINNNANIIQVQWHNKSFTVNIYNKIPNKRQTQGSHFV